MLNDLQEQQAFILNAVAQSVGCSGAVTDALKSDCLSYLARWAVPACEVRRAANPSHDIIQFIRMFNTGGLRPLHGTIHQALRSRVFMVSCFHVFMFSEFHVSDVLVFRFK